MPLEILGNGSGSGSGGFDVTTTVRWYDDFINAMSILTSSAVSGAGAANAVNSAQLTVDRPGQIRQETGTVATGRATAYHNQPMRFGGGFTYKAGLKLLQLSTGAEEFITTLGITEDVAAFSAVSHGIYFLYDRTVNTNWLAVCDDDTGTTTTDTGVAVDTEWNDFSIVMDAGYTSCAFYINGALVATNSTVANFPDSGTDAGYANSRIEKTVGTTEVYQYLDYQLVEYTVDR